MRVDRVPTNAQRILVYGVTGSGKSTAAQRIGTRLGAPVVLADELTWLPGWVPVDLDRQRELIAEVVATDRWVLDTAYAPWLDLVLPRTELIAALDYPRWFSLQRLVRRTVGGMVTKAPRCNGNTESLRHVLGKDSIVGWHFRSFARKRDRIRRWAASAEGPAVAVFERPGQLERWIGDLPARHGLDS